MLIASYAALWMLTLIMFLLVLGLLRQVGELRIRLAHEQTGAEGSQPSIENDGPEIGSRLPDIQAESINDFGRVSLWSAHSQKATLLIFTSPMCESCQQIVDDLNKLAVDTARTVQLEAV